MKTFLKIMVAVCLASTGLTSESERLETIKGTEAAGDTGTKSPVESLTPAAGPAGKPTQPGDTLRLNFRGAPLKLVLDYFSEAAGFIINPEAEMRGTLDVWSKTPVKKDEAVELLNAALRRNGYGLVRTGRVLSVVRLEDARTADLEVEVGNEPGAVAATSELVTQVIPVRYANASQLVSNLQPLLPSSASLSVNDSANTLLLVATKSEIRRVLKIVNALDTSVATVSTLKVFPLRHADAKQLATSIQQLFSPQGSDQNSSLRAQLFSAPGPGGFGPPGIGEAPGNTSSAGNGNSGRAKVTAVADETSNSLIVSAPAGLMPNITGIIEKIDQPVTDIIELRVFQLHNADATELAEQLGQLFPDASKTGAEQAQVQMGGFPPPPPGFGGAQADQATSTERAKKKGQVLAVPDPRTSSLLVSAASTLMPQIARLISTSGNGTTGRTGNTGNMTGTSGGF